MKNEYRFFFHYNKPASATAKRPRISVHYRGKCYIVDNLVCWEPCAGRINKRQPYFVMAGSCNPALFEIVDDIAYIGIRKAKLNAHR